MRIIIFARKQFQTFFKSNDFVSGGGVLLDKRFSHMSLHVILWKFLCEPC